MAQTSRSLPMSPKAVIGLGADKPKSPDEPEGGYRSWRRQPLHGAPKPPNEHANRRNSEGLRTTLASRGSGPSLCSADGHFGL